MKPVKATVKTMAKANQWNHTIRRRRHPWLRELSKAVAKTQAAWPWQRRRTFNGCSFLRQTATSLARSFVPCCGNKV
jgi:hypothetical protein